MTLLTRLVDTFTQTEKRFKDRKDFRIPIVKQDKKIINPRQFQSRLAYKGISENLLFENDFLRERTIGTDDLLAINYLSRGVEAAKSVGRITVNSGRGYGTGFLIAPNVLITNNHVLPSESEATSSYVEFNYEEDADKRPTSPKAFTFNPDKLFITNQELDFTILFVENLSIDGGTKLESFGNLKLIEKTGKLQIGEKVSIIQHPNGQRKQVALRNNEVVDIFDTFLHYETDTEPGSSGSPVFNEEWEVVGLHHSGVPGRDSDGNILSMDDSVWNPMKGVEQIKWVANEGIRVSSIIKFLKLNTNTLQKIFLRDLLQTDNIDPEGNTAISTAYYDLAQDKTDKAAYYDLVDWESPQLFEDLSALLSMTHEHVLPYRPSKFVYPEVDVHPDGKIRSIYSGEHFEPSELILADEQIDLQRRQRILEISKNNALMLLEEYANELDTIEQSLPYNCEHVVPQSWFGKQNPMKGDLHHLFACESRCNSFRSNLAYIDFASYNPEETIREACGMREERNFEPQRNKGIVARATLYYLLRYPKMIDEKYTKDQLKMLIEWHSNADVTEYELHRNQKIFALQGNRNPLIDFPELTLKCNFESGL